MNDRLNEYYAKQQKYLIFLRPLPNKEEVFAKYELDPAKTYFNAFETENTIFSAERDPMHGAPRKGIIKVPDQYRKDLIERIEALCAAMNGADKNSKIKKLQKLARSDDEELKTNAIYAIKALQTEGVPE